MLIENGLHFQNHSFLGIVQRFSLVFSLRPRFLQLQTQARLRQTLSCRRGLGCFFGLNRQLSLVIAQWLIVVIGFEKFQLRTEEFSRVLSTCH